MFYSPLRYPGGKAKLAPFMEIIINNLGHKGGTYIEPFAGGAGIAIELLEKDIVNEIVINDLDKGIYSFWKAITTETDRFIRKIYDTPITIDEWKRQRIICNEDNKKYSFDLGFATFYMNRTNRSGIIKGGVIGGLDQKGIWKIDARFNKDELARRIIRIANKKNKIHIYNKDIASFLKKYCYKYEGNALIYFDPPYFEKGKQLYLNFFEYEDHIRIERLLRQIVKCDWIITYDDVLEIEKIYHGYNVKRFDLRYSVSSKRKASEIIIFKNSNMIPSIEEMKNKKIKINLH